MHNSPTQTPQKNIRPLFCGLALLACIGAIAAGVHMLGPSPAHPFAAVDGSVQPDAVEAYLESRAGTEALSFNNGTIALPREQRTAPAAPYRISVAVRLPGPSFRDFSVRVPAGTKAPSFVADGFHPGDLVSLTLNGRDVFARLPADWSGKLELTAPVTDTKAGTACITVVGKTETLGLCHALPERRPS